MVIVGAVVLPHGTMTLDPGKPGLPDGAQSLHTATLKACEELAKLSPTLIVLSTPHGICLSGKYGVYVNNHASGHAEWNGHWSDFTVNVDLASSTARSLVEYWNRHGVPAEGIMTFANTEAPLRWGEAVPLWFLRKAGCTAPVVLLAEPAAARGSSSADRAKYCATDEFQERQTLAGRELRRFLDTHARDERVVVAISGDLAHTHAHGCTDPLYMPHPDWKDWASSPAAVAFDQDVVQWCESLQGHLLLDRARSTVSEAMVCGYSGLVMLHALLCGSLEKTETPPWTGKVLECSAPTYFGMIVATFYPIDAK